MVKSETLLHKHGWVIGVIIGIMIFSSIWAYQDLTGFKLTKLKLADVLMATCQISGYQNCSEPTPGNIVHGACFPGYTDNGSVCILITNANPPQSSYDPKVGCPYGSVYNGQICVYASQAQYGSIPVSASSAPPGTPTCVFQSYSLLKPSLLALLCIPAGTPPTTPTPASQQSSGITCQYGTNTFGACNPAPSNTGSTNPTAPTPTIFNNGQSCVAAGGFWNSGNCQVPIDQNQALANVQTLLAQAEAKNNTPANNSTVNTLVQSQNSINNNLANNNAGGLNSTTNYLANNPIVAAMIAGLIFTIILTGVIIGARHAKNKVIPTQ